MTDLATALATPKLTPFDGQDVARTSIKVTRAGDSLSKALGIEPQELHHREKVYVVLECEVAKVGFDPIPDTDLLVRVHTLKAGTGTIIDGAVVEEAIAEQARKIDTAHRHAKGEFNLDEAALDAEHDDGQHASGLREGCPKCAAEAAATEAERDLMDTAADKPKPRRRR